MKKIAYTIIGLALPVFGFSQSSATPADTGKKQNAPFSAVQAVEASKSSPSVLAPPQQTGVAEQLKSGQKPGADVNTRNSNQPVSAVQMIEQTHQPDPQSGSAPH